MDPFFYDCWFSLYFGAAASAVRSILKLRSQKSGPFSGNRVFPPFLYSDSAVRIGGRFWQGLKFIFTEILHYSEV